MPKVTQSFSLIPPSTANGGVGEAERMLIQRENDITEFQERMNYSSKDLLLSHIHLDQKLQKDVDNIYLTVSTRIYRKRDSRNDSC